MLATLSAAVSILGSSLLLLPLSVLFAIVLWRGQAAPLAVRWSAALAAALTVMVVLKLYGHACGLPVLLERVASPSGHAAFSAFFYGSIALIIVRATTATWRQAAVLASAGGLVAAIGLSRVVLHAHSKLEVLIGLLVGGSAVLAFAVSSAAYPPVRLRLSMPVAAMVLACGLLVISTGDPGLVENAIRVIASHVRQEVLLCPVDPTGLAYSGDAGSSR